MVKCDRCLYGECDPGFLYHAGQFISDEEYNKMKKSLIQLTEIASTKEE